MLMTDTVSLLQDGFTGKPGMLRTMQAMARMTDSEAATFCLVSPETYRRWKMDRTPKASGVRLLSLRAGFVAWPGWEKFFFCSYDGRLYHEDLRDGFAPEFVLQAHWNQKELDVLRGQNQALRLQLQVAEKEAESLRAELGAREHAGDSGTGATDNVVPFPAFGVPYARQGGSETPTGDNYGDEKARGLRYLLRRWFVRRANG